MAARKKATKKKVRSTTTTKSKKTVAAPPAQQATTTNFSDLVVMFLAFFAVNSIVVFLANIFFGDAVVLGTHLYAPFRAVIQSMAVLSLMIVGATPIVEAMAMSVKMKLDTVHWLLVLFGINFVGLWIVSRFAELLGLGLASWQVAVALAVALTLVQAVTYSKVVKTKA